MIRQIHIQNYKALRDVTLDLTPFHVLIGPNDSGKTSILEAVAALCRSVDQPNERWFSGMWKGRELVWHGATTPEVTIAADFSDSDSLARGTEYYSFETTWGFSLGSDSRHVDTLKLRGDGRPIRGALSGVRYFRFDARRLALPAARNSDVRFRMTASGFGLPIFLEDLREANIDGYLKLLDQLRQIFPTIKDIKSEPVIAATVEWRTLQREQAHEQADDSDKGPSGERRQETWGKNILFEFSAHSTPVPASQVSDGVLLTLAYLAILNLPSRPRLLLIEEPETGIYPPLLQRVVKILRDIVGSQSHTQVIMTTHAPYVLDEFQPEDVTLCRKEQDGSISVHPLSKVKAIKKQLDVFSLGELWVDEIDDIAKGANMPSEAPAR